VCWEGSLGLTLHILLSQASELCPFVLGTSGCPGSSPTHLLHCAHKHRVSLLPHSPLTRGWCQAGSSWELLLQDKLCRKKGVTQSTAVATTKTPQTGHRE
jgi:hypothetical protein